MRGTRERFTSSWVFILTLLGMAIGTGNIWRFPRIVASSGGGAFLIPWTIFLFLWSIPLIMTEFALGRWSRRGVISTFNFVSNGKLTWMGAFVTFCTLAIMFYYSSVTGWCIKYFSSALGGAFGKLNLEKASDIFDKFVNSWETVLFHAVAIGIAGMIVFKGIVKGIEKANLVFIPSLFLLLIVCLIRVATLDGGTKGFEYLFNPDFSKLKDYNIWLEALSQSAWSTGAGWGLVLTYAVYMRKREEIVLTSFITGFGNNSASLLAGMVIFGTVFATAGSTVDAQSMLAVSGRAGTGLTFETLPVLFSHIPGGYLVSVVFFLALSFAAMSSLISLVELGTRVLIDAGFTRRRAVLVVATAGFILGLPSAISMGVFENQDWVWGLGLILSGFFYSVIAIRVGVKRFRKELLNKDVHVKVGKWWEFCIVLLPVEFAFLLVWWFSKSIGWEKNWWNPFAKFSLMTVIFQWVVVLVILAMSNSKLQKITGEQRK